MKEVYTMKALDYSCSYCKCADLKLVDDQRGILKCPNCGYEMFEDEAESPEPYLFFRQF